MTESERDRRTTAGPQADRDSASEPTPRNQTQVQRAFLTYTLQNVPEKQRVLVFHFVGYAGYAG
eukprot:3386722-Rhodomonas_salina.1